VRTCARSPVRWRSAERVARSRGDSVKLRTGFGRTCVVDEEEEEVEAEWGEEGAVLGGVRRWLCAVGMVAVSVAVRSVGDVVVVEPVCEVGVEDKEGEEDEEEEEVVVGKPRRSAFGEGVVDNDADEDASAAVNKEEEEEEEDTENEEEEETGEKGIVEKRGI
jgi:hypothetical protein